MRYRHLKASVTVFDTIQNIKRKPQKACKRIFIVVQIIPNGGTLGMIQPKTLAKIALARRRG